jgi:transposase
MRWLDTNGPPVRPALTPGEAHDNRLAGKLLPRLKTGSMLLADRGHDADWIREIAVKKDAWANIPPKRNRNDPIGFSKRATWSNGSLAGSSNAGSRRTTTNSRPTTSHLSSLRQLGYGCALMSRRASYR